MKYGFEGIGCWSATFACSGSVAEGRMVKISGNGQVSACADGDSFAGMADTVSRDGLACSVTLGGMVTASYTGAAPALGWTALVADGSGGVKAAAGRSCLVVSVDQTAKQVAFVL